jgi:hypothetical protein
MSDEEMSDLLREAAFSFVGTVEHLGAATMEDLPIGERTAVVRVDQVLHAPEAFAHLAGSSVTLELRPDIEPPEVGATFVFFANGLAFGISVALLEIGRRPVEAIEPHLALTAESGGTAPFESLQRQVEGARLREHAAGADAIVLGRVVGLERASGSPVREHDPDWWRATLHVTHVEKGDVEQDAEIQALYANSLDVRWRESPKPKASQNGLWFLHSTEGELATLAPFQIISPDDLQPPQNVELLRDNGS